MKETTASRRISRRNFLRNSSAMAGMAATAPYVGWSSTASGAAPSKDLRFACLGAHGKARRNIADMATVPNTTMVAVAEVDSGRLDFVNEQSPKTKIYKDWRVLLEKEAAGLDAVIVSTPDHMHAPMAMTAMQAGLNVYCEKPLTRTVFEARALRLFAEQNGIITQMGNQRSQHTANQTVVHALRNRLVGTVKDPLSAGQVVGLDGGVGRFRSTQTEGLGLGSLDWWQSDETFHGGTFSSVCVAKPPQLWQRESGRYGLPYFSPLVPRFATGVTAHGRVTW